MTIEQSIVPHKIAELVDMIARKKNISQSDATYYLYNSDLYHRLYDPKEKWWYFSGESLYDELEKSKKKEKEFFSQKELLFVIFCVERYAAAKSKDSIEVFTLFEKKALTSYLKENYEILHSQGEQYILEEIDIYLKRRRK